MAKIFDFPWAGLEGELYHGVGTREAWAKIQAGEPLRIGPTVTHDPGDYGAGVYLTGSRVRAACYAALLPEGRAVLRVKVKLSHAVDFNWKGGSTMDRSHPCHGMIEKLNTAYGNPILGGTEPRKWAAARWRAGLLADGYDGVIVSGLGETEVCVFEPEKSILAVAAVLPEPDVTIDRPQARRVRP